MNEKTDVTEALRQLSAQDFRNFGASQIAYIQTEKTSDHVRFHLYSADGAKLGMFRERSEAVAEAHARDLDLMILH